MAEYRDEELERDRVCARVKNPSQAMIKERAVQRKILWVSRIAALVCAVPVMSFILDTDNFIRIDPEGAFLAMIRKASPWAMSGFCVFAALSVMMGRSLRRETDAASAQLKEEEKAGITPPAGKEAPGYGALRWGVLLLAAAVLVFAAISHDGTRELLHRAIEICVEHVRNRSL